MSVHAIQGDLIMQRRTLEPIKTLIYTLRRYDVDRVAALANGEDPAERVEGFMSWKARTYLVSTSRSFAVLVLVLTSLTGGCPRAHGTGAH